MKKIAGLVLSIICIAGLVFPGTAFADAAMGGEHNFQQVDFYVVVDAWDGYVNFRYGPGLEYGIDCPINNGNVLHITQTAENYYDEFTWGQTEWNGYWGWVSLHECTYTDNPNAQPQTEPQTEPQVQPVPQTNEDGKDTVIELNDDKLKSGEWQDVYDNIIMKIADAMMNVYAPYSEYYAGALLIDKDGKAFTGIAIENENPDLNIHAETCALAKAVSEGSKEFKLITVIGGGAADAESDYYIPCEDCLKRLKEFAEPEEFYVLTIQINQDGAVGRYEVRTLSKLLAD